MLKIEHLSKSFNDKKIIDDVSLTVNHGEIAVLLGSSGVGKSTLLRVLNNLETPDAGAFTLDGKPLDLTTVNKNHTVGFVFQNFNLFENLTVEQNITLALEKVAGKSHADAVTIAHNLLSQYGLADKKNMYASSLSGGQKQRLALARTLALQPQIICLDEPTSALDPLLTNHVAQSIQDLAQQGFIVLVATHDTSLIERLKATIYLMHQGKIVQSATSTDLADRPEKYGLIKQFISGN
ncbi:amino acid ABC transporter ATP-binding protein [Candidatus Dependentiae bacterium Noda2021]|nr:amino acid ABC transporter ATP-binding protein [Candidatus Dependentiae bacterium Noda2021]